ncbi:SEC-C domain-containing protein [Aneurinibacillus sp. Ricciae_BoGa-3]|uniref:SEC-C domain-containing protein n=1 Tax=Aneurinibacillus sp. Ricciae_BoGa-3 TaxID=3022697 RepID=UPI00233FFA7E|nr:SEC-C domain-containing protein [Aneurinibacillus sp. Ricciae_BoGa-3]WCK54419.1 SEC-C domain-containing protein [Aneurinibacillus sp. Ricciae_BoGa-3]
MSVRRNDPCPCGSGKKYKNCCLKENNIVAIRELREQRLAQAKSQLTQTITEFVNKKINESEEQRLRHAFKGNIIEWVESSDADRFFSFWLIHLHRFENGLRGIEWFWEEKRSALASDQQQILENWLAIHPRIIQIVEKSEQGIMVEDLITYERFAMPYAETLQYAIPWAASLVMMERSTEEDTYNMHGVYAWLSPESVQRAISEVKKSMADNHASYERIMIDQYVELFRLILHDNQSIPLALPAAHGVELIYDVLNADEALTYLLGQPSILAGDIREQTHTFTVAGEWYQYTDSLMSGLIYITPLRASLELAGSILTAHVIDKQYTAEVKELLASAPALVFHEEKPGAEGELTYSMFATAQDKNTPVFAGFAQNQLRLKDALQRPLEQFGNESPAALLKAGRIKEVEGWANMAEYASFMAQVRRTGSYFPNFIDDFNPFRESLGVKSPFTAGIDRATALEPCANPFNRSESAGSADNNSEASLDAGTPVEAEWPLGITPQQSKAFYANDIVAFFTEKTEGKSSSTLKKYEKHLGILVSYLQGVGEQAPDWSVYSESFWSGMVKYAADDLSPAQLKVFVSVISAFAKWLDKRNGTELQARVDTASDALKVK